MRKIDIFVSSPEDVRKERSLVERAIRAIAAEFDVPVTVTYSNWRKTIRQQDIIPVQGKNGSDEGRSWLCPCFWEYQDSNLDKDYREQIPNTGSYDLVISILWSRLGTRISSACVMPDGSQPQTANEYEVAWVLDQLKRTPGFPELRIYRNQSTPPAPLQPREERESFFREWDAVQEFFKAWEREPPFAEACINYYNLQEFESLFREHFRDFLARQVDREIVTRRKVSLSPAWSLEPYQGLKSFEFEQGSIFFGRTKTVGEILDALNRQSNAQKPFVLVLGPARSGKSSLVKAGVLPLLTEVGNSAGEGPWRRASTRPGSGITGQDPLDALATALLSENGLPELQSGNIRDAWRNLASELREQPDIVASRAKDILDQISRKELDHLLHQDDVQSLIPGRIEFAELARHRKLRRARPQAQLALVIDHLEDLFTAGFSQETQQQYVAAMACLVRTQRIVVVATLQSEFYKSYQRLSELVTLSSPAGRYDIQAPVRQELEEVIRLPAKAARLRFDREKQQGLDEVLANAAAERTDSLPLLEYVLSQLYKKQLDRRDGLLRFSDYREIGAFDGALARRAESAFAALSEDAQHSFDFVFRRLVALGPDGKTISRPALYKDLTSSPEQDDRRNAGSRELVECMLREGLFTAENESGNIMVVRIADPVLLSKWPRIEQWLVEDQAFVRMRDRIDGCMRLWRKRGQRPHDLLRPGLSLADGETLINHFHSSLSDAEIDYIQKSLAEQKRLERRRLLVGLPVLIVLVSLAAVAGIHWFSKEIRQEYDKITQKITDLARGEPRRDDTELRQLEEKARLAQQRAETALTERASLEAQLKKAQDDSQRAQQNAGLASSKRSDLQTQLKQALQQAQQDAELATSQRSDLQTQLKQAQDKLQQAQQDAELATSQRSDLQTQLKQAQDKLQRAQQDAELATSQRSDLQTQLKQAQDKLQQAQQDAELATSQRSDLQTQLKQAQDKLQQAQQDAELATSQRSDLQTQLKQAQDKLQQAQQNAELAASQRSDLQTQLKEAQDKFKQAQQDAKLAASQRSDLQTQLKQAQDKLQQAQQNAELVASQRSDLQTQLKQAQDKLQQAQQNAELAASQRSDLQTQLKEAQDKFQQAQQNGELATSQRSNLQTQLKQAQDNLQQAQQNAEVAASQRSDLQTQLKQAQDKLQQAQQNAEAAASQRSDFQTRLKQAQDKLQQAQQNAEAAASQRSDLQTQLKQAQDKLQQAQHDAELASSGRTDLLAQLKKAEEKAQLAQKILDLVEGQTHSEDSGNAKSETSKRNTDSTPGRSRSGRALPLDAGQNPSPWISTQPLIPPVQSANH